MKIEVSRGALSDLERLRLFLFAESPTAAAKIYSLLINAILTLDVFPNRGRPVRGTDSRELFVPFGRSGYLIRYVVFEASDKVLVVAIRHGREGT